MKFAFPKPPKKTSDVKSRNAMEYENHFKYYDYYIHFNQKSIHTTLQREAENYVRKLHKVPDCFNIETYYTRTGKVAVLELNTPKKRCLYRKASRAYFNGDSSLMDELKNKYGFIPKPSNVLKKFIDYGFIKSQDAEHLYHSEPVDWKFSRSRKDFEAAYATKLERKDSLVPHFNGYSCMSQEPKIGTFYYFFGAYMLIFYKKGTKDIIGRAVLWKYKNKYYFKKAYVEPEYQIKAAEVIEQLQKQGKISYDTLPDKFSTSLQRMPGKEPHEIYEEVCEKVEVPYIDEDLELSSNKQNLSFYGTYKTKKTSCNLLEDYGIYHCDECGDDIDEDDIIEIGEYVFCNRCARYCNDCDEWFAPDADGDYVDGAWVCEDCLSNYSWCEDCNQYKDADDMVTLYDKDGGSRDVCKDCVQDQGRLCEDCNDWYEYNALTLQDGNHWYCEGCLENHKKEA